MDYQHILNLIAVLMGNAGQEFGALKAGGADLNAPVAQTLCPRPLPRMRLKERPLFCGTVQVPEDNAKPDGKKIPLKFSILKSWSQYPEA